MKKIYLLLIPILMIIFSTKAYAATSSIKNNPINNQTKIENDCKSMGIDYSYYKNMDDSDYDRTDVIGLWEYYYDDGSIDLFVYLYNPYIGKSDYNEILEYEKNLRFKEAYLYYEGNNVSATINLKGLDLELISVDNQISKYRYSLSNKDINLKTMYKRNYEIKSIEYNYLNNDPLILTTSPFKASFVNSNSEGDTVNVNFEYDGYMFIFEKEAFKIYPNLDFYEVTIKEKFNIILNNVFETNAQYTVYFPEFFSFNFNIPKEYDVIDINEIEFEYGVLEKTFSKESLTGAIIDGRAENMKNTVSNEPDKYGSKFKMKKEVYKKDDSFSVTGKYLDTVFEFNDLKRIDSNKNRYNESKLNQEYIKVNLEKYYSYEWSLIFDVLPEEFTERKIDSSGYISKSEYTLTQHSAHRMKISRMNYTDSNGEKRNVIVNQGADVDETTEIPYYPENPEQSFFEWLVEKIKEFYIWLFELVGANTFFKKAMVVAISILSIPILIPILISLIIKLIPALISLILSIAKIIIRSINNLLKGIFKRKKE